MAAALVLTSCDDNSDELDALKKRIKTLESMTGSTEPITFNYSTTDYNDDAVIKTTSYRFKGSDSQTSRIMDFGDGEYAVSVTRFSNINADESAQFYFVYDTETGDVSDTEVYIDFYHFAGYSFNSNFHQNDTESEFTITVNSFNAETGMIDVAIHAATTENSGYNYYEGNPQTIDLAFKGKLGFYSMPN